jgi:long-chain acyl-CoA synthetase
MRLLLEAWKRTLRASRNAPALIDAGTGRIWTRRNLDESAAAWTAEHGAFLAHRLVLFAEPSGLEWMRIFLGLLKADAVAATMEAGEPAESQLAQAQAIGAAFRWTAGGLKPTGLARLQPRDGRRYLKLTSGSTGAPRPLAFTDAQLLADGRQVCATMGIRGDDLNYGLVPFGHSYGLGNLVLPLLARGTAIVCGTTALPQAMAAEIERWAPTVFPSVPALLRALAGADIAPERLQSLRTVVSAGSPLPPEVAWAFQARFARKIHNFYGSSETGGIAYDRTGEATLAGRSVGRPLRGVRLRFGRGGRFTVESAAVHTIGNRQTRGSAGWGRHRPADLVRPAKNGELILVGRTGRMLKVAGRRLDPLEVELALKRLPGVRDALVAVHPARPDALAAAVAGVVDPETAREALRPVLAAWKIPRKIVVLAEFPLTGRGKTDVRRLRELLSHPAPRR